jgi:hypothetical protein
MTSTAHTHQRPKVVIVCSTCGTQNVLVDAWAEWNPSEQKWELAKVCQTVYCQECDGESSIVELPFTPH